MNGIQEVRGSIPLVSTMKALEGNNSEAFSLFWVANFRGCHSLGLSYFYRMRYIPKYVIVCIFIMQVHSASFFVSVV